MRELAPRTLPEAAPKQTLTVVRERPPILAAKYDAWQAAVKEQSEAPRYTSGVDGRAAALYQQFQADVALGGERLDSWTNLLTGIGTTRDKVTSTTFENNGQLSFGDLESLYHNEDMAARIADAVPEQMFREGYELRVDNDADKADEVQDAAEALEVDAKFEEAIVWARVYGGSKLLVGVSDGQNADKPVNEANIKSIDFLRVLDRYMLFPVAWFKDPLAPNFGEPEVYRILTPNTLNPFGASDFSQTALVHASRLIHFGGARTSLRRRRANFGWDDSVLQRVYQVLLSFGVSWAGVVHLMSDAAQGVMKVKGLLNMIASNQKEAMLERAAINDETRSSARMMMIDAEDEDFERKPTPFQGIPELVDRFAQRLAGAADMPLTVLMGTSPGGWNATGESDLTNWYNKIASMQRRQLKPKLQQFYRLLMLSKEGPTGGQELDLEICFRPLWTATENEMADVRLKQAQTDQIEFTIGMATAEELAVSRHGANGWSSETSIDLDLREKLMTDDQAQEKQLGGSTIEPDPALGPDGKPLAPPASGKGGSKGADGKPAKRPPTKNGG